MDGDIDISQRRTLLSRANELVYDRKFDVALRDSHSIGIIKRIQDQAQDAYDVQILRLHLSATNTNIEDVKYNTNVYPHLFNNVTRISPNEHKIGLEKLLNIIQCTTEIQLQTQFQNVSNVITPDFHGFLEDSNTQLRRSKLIPRLLIAYYSLTSLVDHIPKTDSIRIRQKTYTQDLQAFFKISCRNLDPLGFSVRWSKSTALIYLNDEVYLVPRAYLLLIHNKIADTLSVLFLASNYPDSIFQDNCLQATEEFLLEYCQLARKYDQKFFKISKVLESIIIGESLIKIEGSGNSAFLDNIASSLNDDIKFDYMSSRFREIITTKSTALMHEFGCLSKIMGHPFCKMGKTAQDMYDKTHEERTINIGAVTQAARHAKKEFVEKYIEKMNSWPPCHLHNATRSMQRAQEENINPQRLSHVNKYGPVTLEDWDAVHLDKCEEFDRLENFIPYVKDRTISLLKTDVVKKYINADAEYMTDWRKTRALLAYLFLPYKDTEHLSYLELYANQEWESMSNLLIVRLVPKEKEHKDSARCFGCKPAKERARTITIGVNAARYLSKYSDSEAMTLSEISLSKKMFAFRHMSRAYENFSQIVICLDASGWNSRLRDAAIAPVSASTLDPVFGEQMFEQVHKAYHHTYFYLPDVEEVYSWQDQQGGVEGQDTYVWVHSYIQHLKVVMTHFGYPYRLVVKGDDARLVILIPPQYLEDETIDSIRGRIVARVTELAGDFGYQMKPEDCYGSINYCSFSKNAFIGDTEMPQCFRKIQKAYGANNAFMNTVDDYAASSFSNCHSASKTSPSPIACYTVALLWFYIYITRHPSYKLLSDIEYVALGLIPNMLGGFPVIYLHNFYQRAESDLLSSFISIYYHSSIVNQELWSVFNNIFNQIIVDPMDNIAMLCIDPYSLPLKKPSGSKGVLRNALANNLKVLTKNEQIKQLFLAKKSGFQEELMNRLRSLNILSPKIMNQIYSSSPEGLISELISKFESGKSMLDAVLLKQQRFEGYKILKMAYRSDLSLHKFRISLLKRRLKGSSELPIQDLMCPALASQRLREELWGKRIEGITQPPVYHTVTIVTLMEALQIPRADIRHFIVNWEPPHQSSNIFSEGRHDAFLGDSTSKGLISPEVKITSHDIHAIKIVGLLETYRWTTVTTPIEQHQHPLSRLVADMVNKYTGRNIQDFIPFSAARPLGKTIQHHVRANQFRPSIVPNTLQNIYTWCNFDMLSHKELTTVHGHSRFNFHEIKCWTASALAYNTWLGNNNTKSGVYWMVTCDCEYCNTLIEETTLVYDGIELPTIELVHVFETASLAINDILKEVDEFNPEIYHIHQFEPEEDDIASSINAVCQALMDSEWSQSITYQELEAHHVLTSKGDEILKMWGSVGRKSTILDYSDLLGIDIDLIIDALVPLVISHIFNRFVFAQTIGLGTILTLTPANVLPWTVILSRLAQINKLRPLQARMSARLNKTANIIDNPLTYSSKFGDECMKLWHRNQIDQFHIALCSSKADTEIANSVKTRVTALRTLMVEREVRLFKQVIKGTDLEVEAVLTTFCYMVRLEIATMNLDFVTDDRGNVVDNEFHTIYLGQVDMEDEFLPILETISANKYVYLLQHIKHLDYNTWKTLILEDFDDDTIRALEYQDERLINAHRNPTIFVSRMDLLTCKNALQRLREVLPERDVEWQNRRELLPLIGRNINSPFVRIPYYEPLSEMNQPSRIVEENMERCLDLESHSRVVIDKSWLYTPIGLFNISMSRLAWLINDLQLQGMGTDKICAILGDGYGGYTQVLNQLLHNSKFIFMTSPTSVGENPIPVLYDNQGDENEVDSYLIQVDRWDLTEISNFIALEAHRNNLVDIVLCDAEMVPAMAEKETYLRMWYNVCTYAVRNAKQNSILVIKIYLDYWRELLVCINLIRRYTSFCSIVQSTGSPYSLELYLVAQIQQAVPIPYNSQPQRKYPPERAQMAVLRYSEMYMDRFRVDYAGLISTQVRAIYPPFIIRLCQSLPSYGWSQLESVIRTSMDYNTLRIRANEPNEMYLERILGLLSTWMKPLEEQLKSGVRHDKSAQASLYFDTYTHTLISVYKLCVIAGFKSIWYNISKGVQITSLEILHHDYAAFTHDYRRSIGDWDRTYEYSINKDNKIGKHYNMFAGWCSGAKWACLALSWGLAT